MENKSLIHNLLTILTLLFFNRILVAQTNFWVPTNASSNSHIYDILIMDNDDLFIATNNGVQRSTDFGASWVSVNNGLPIGYSKLAFNSLNKIFVGREGVYISSDNGEHWLSRSIGLPTSGNPKVAVSVDSKDILYAGIIGIFRSTDEGLTWTNIGLSNISIMTISLKTDSIIFVGTLFKGIYRSVDRGNSWAPANLGVPANTSCLSIAVSPNGYLFAWMSISDPPNSYTGVFRSTNNGNSWVLVGLRNLSTTDITSDYRGDIYAATFENGVFRSSDNGNSWYQINTGLSDTNATCLYFNPDGFLYAGTFSGKVFHSINSINDIRIDENLLPHTIQLFQNYPNPFNVITNIQFRISKNEDVWLRIFDDNGKEIGTLIKDTKTPGDYSVGWDANNFPSGVYFYQLSTNNFSLVRKLILMK